jgi:type VI protein secretion system component Hcp
MLADNFMWFPGPGPDGMSEVEGETTDAWFSRKGAFELLSFNFSMTQSDLLVPDRKVQQASFSARKSALEQAFKQGAADRSGDIEAAEEAVRAKFEAFTVTKMMDLASPKLYKACSTGTRFPAAMLALRKPGGEYLLYIQFIFRDVAVTGITWDGGEGDKLPQETLTFTFKAMGLQYIKQAPRGQMGDRPPQEWRWSTATNSSTLEIQGLPKAPDYVTLSTGGKRPS